MSLRKLLFALSTITLVGTPVLSVVACTKAQGTVDLTKLKAMTAIEGDMKAINPKAVNPSEIKIMVNNTISRAIANLGLKGTKVGIDFNSVIKTNTGANLQGNTDLTADDSSKRTFKVNVNTTGRNAKLIGASEVLVTLLEMSVVTNLNTLNSLTVTKEDVKANNLQDVNVPEIKAIFDKATTRAVNKLDGVRGVSVGNDFTYTITNNAGAELIGTYNLTTDDDNQRTFKVTVKTTNKNKKLIGESKLCTVILPKMIIKIVLNNLRFFFLNQPVSSVTNPRKVLAREVLTLFSEIITTSLNLKTKPQVVEELTDYTVTIKDFNNQIVTQESDKTYNFVDNVSSTKQNAFTYLIEALENSEFLEGKYGYSNYFFTNFKFW